MPAAGPSNTRARQRRRKLPPRKFTPGPTNTAASYVSTGRAVQKAASQQQRRAASAPYVSQGRAVAKRATQLGRQSARAAPGRQVNPIKAAERFIAGPGRYYKQGAFSQAPVAQMKTGHAFSRDLKTLGEGGFVGAYQLGAATYEASPARDVFGGKSSTKRAEKLAKGILSGYVHSAPGELLQGHFGKALSSVQQHPGIAVLDTAAGVSAAGKLAGAGVRTATSFRRGSTIRPPLALTDDAGAVKAGAYREREYAKGLDRQIPQRLRDSKREPVRDANGKVVTVMQRGKKVPVLKPTRAEQRHGNVKEADIRAGRDNAVERQQREVQGRTARIKGVRGRRGRDLVAMVHEGTIPSLKHIDPKTGHVMTGPAAFRRYLLDHAERLDREHAQRLGTDPVGYRHSGDLEYNRYRAQLARDAADNPKVLKQAEKIVAEGTRLGREGRALDTEAGKVGVISDEARAKGAALIPGKIEHLGGRHFTVKEHAHLEREALKVEERAKDALLGVKRTGGTGPGGVDRRVMARIPDTQRKAELERELASARAHRIAVSGRDPKRVVAHETARGKAESARAAEKSARAKIARLHNARQRLIGTQSSRRGRRQGEARKGALKQQRGQRPEGKATAEEQAKLAKLDREIKQARATAADLGRTARKAEHELKRTPMPPIRAAIRTAEGKHLPDSEAERFFRERGRDPETVGYLPHVPPRNRAFHQRFAPGTRPVADKAGPEGTRTGEAYRKGATEASEDLIKQQHVKLRTQIVKAQQLDALVRERGLKHPEFADLERRARAGEQLSKRERRIVDSNGYLTGKEAEEYGKRIVMDTRTGPRDVILAPNGEKLVPMRAFADRLSEETKRVIREDLQGPAGMETLGQRLLNDRVIPTADLGRVPARNVVLVPEQLVARLEKHLQPPGEIERLLQMINRPFRFAVLAQPRWLAGNFIEPYFIRLPTVGSGIVNVPGLLNDIRISRKVIAAGKRSGDPRVRQAALELEAHQTGGMFIGGRGASNRRLFEDSEVYKRMVARVPATRQMYDLAHKVGQVLIAPGRAYFWANREGIERWAQHAAIGRSARRDMVEFFGSWQKATRFGEEAAKEAARGLVNTPTQARFMREQHKLLGQYGDFSPTLRRIVQGPAPFLPWALNSARFVYWTMPTQRTILTSLLLKTQAVVADEWKQQHSDLPPSLQGTTLALDARRKDGGFTPGARYTPFGLTGPVSQGNFEGLDQALPAVAGPVNAIFKGQDPFGNDLKTTPSAGNPQGTVAGWGKVPVAANELGEALIPYLSQIRRLREHGETAYPTSTVLSPKTKAGTSHGMSAANRTFNPFRPTYVKGSTASTSSSAGGPPAKQTPQERILERRAHLISQGGSAQARMDALLEKRAKILANR